MTRLKFGDLYFNLDALDAFYFFDKLPTKTLTIYGGGNKWELELISSKYEEFKTKFSEFLLNSDGMLDCSDYSK